MFKEYFYFLRRKSKSQVEKEKQPKKSQVSSRGWGLAARLEPRKMTKSKKK